MRFAVALVTLLIAGALIVAGVAQRTVLKPADHVTVAASIPSDVHYVVVPGSVLTAHGAQQRLHVAGSGTTFAAVGKPADVQAWLAGERYAELRVASDGSVAKPVVHTAPSLRGFAGGGTPDPAGSDLWVDEQRAQHVLDWTTALPSSYSVLVAANGADAAPGTVDVTWPVRTATPFAVPLIAAGGALAVIGLLLYVWALVHVRRRRGPRRKPPAKTPRRPAPPKYRQQRPASAAPVPGRGRRSVRQRVAVPAVGALTVVLGGAVLAPAPAPASAATAPASAVVTESQAAMIVQRVARTAADADDRLDAKTAATRFGGAALALRQAAYTIKKKDRKADLPEQVPVGADADMKLIVPQSTTSWPRTLFVVVQSKSNRKARPLALSLVQNDPRSDYVVQYANALEPEVSLPTMPNALVGASRLTPATPVLRIAPAQLAADYGSLLLDADAPAGKPFITDGDELVKGVGEAAKAKYAKKNSGTVRVGFSDVAADPASVIALSTADPGALVAVHLQERWTVKPKRSGVTIRPSGGTKALLKVSSTSDGYAAVYGYQLLFSVPPAGSSEPVKLLGYAQGLVSAKEL